MPKLWKHLNSNDDAKANYCVVDVNNEAEDGDRCTKKQTMSRWFVREPFPELLMLNINWFSD